MRRALAVLLLVPGLLAVAPAAEAVPTCGGKKATIVLGDGDDRAVGTKGDDVVVLGGGDDVFYRSGGHDIVCGGAGDDIFYDADGSTRKHELYDGGSGTDRLVLNGTGLHIDVPAGRETGHGGDLFRRVEVFDGSPGVDVFLGGPAAESFDGAGGADRIDLGAGDDTATLRGPGTLDAGEGDDELAVQFAGSPTIDAGPGDDIVQVGASSPTADGGEGNDYVGFWYDGEGVIVDLAAGSVSQATYGDFGALAFENVFGTAGDDTIYGTDGPNILQGGEGTDTIDGRDGDDACAGEVVVNC